MIADVPDVSIHAPRAGGDVILLVAGIDDMRVSIHAPRAGGDFIDPDKRHLFLCFNPRPPRRGRQVIRGGKMVLKKFQSTPPAQGATLS